MEALAFTLAKEERPHGIRVNIVAPGLVETEMGRRLMKASAGVKDLRDLDKVMPFGRVCQPEDVANVVRFLVSRTQLVPDGRARVLRRRRPAGAARLATPSSRCPSEQRLDVRCRRARERAE